MERRREGRIFLAATADSRLRLIEAHHFEAVGLEPGRYRAFDRISKAYSAPFTVAGETGERRVSLDLSRTAWARGEIDAPHPDHLGDVRIARSDSRRRHVDLFEPDADGCFRVRVPGDAPVDLIVWHPFLAAPRDARRFTVTQPDDDLLFVLDEVTAASLTLPPIQVERLRRDLPPTVVVRLYRVDGPAVPVSVHHAVDDGDGQWCFGGYRTGRYNVWIDVPGHAPAVLHDVALGPAADLGAIPLGRGGRITVDVPTVEGRLSPALDIRAVSLDGPRYHRSASCATGEPLVVDGLGPGRFRITVRSRGDVLTLVGGTSIVATDGDSETRVAMPSGTRK